MDYVEEESRPHKVVCRQGCSAVLRLVPCNRFER